MTTAGDIRLGVDIDAGDLRGELTRAVREAMGPVLADLQRDLRGVQGEYKDTTRAAEQSAVKQAAAADKVERGIHGITNEQRKLAQQATTTGLVSTRSLRAQARAVDEQARAWDRLAAAKARAAAVPDPGVPRGPPGGRSGSSGGRGGSRGGGFGLTSPLGLNGIAAASTAIPAATTAVVNLVGAVQQLMQAGLAVPGVFAGIASSVGTAVIGFNGMSDAISALWEAAASGDAKDLEKAAEALKDMAPAAVEVAKAVAGTRDEIIDLQKAVAQNMFEGVAADFDNFSGKVLPRAKTGLTDIARSWNATLKELLRVGGSDSTLNIMDRIFGNTAEGQKRANAAIEPLVKGFGTLAAAGSDTIPRLADGLTKLSQRFSDFITKADSTGDLARWIDEGFKAAANLGESLLNVGKIITDITKAAGGDGGFLKWLREATGQLHEFLSSEDGQEKLTKFFEEGRESLKQWAPILKDLVSLAGDVLDGFQQWGDVLLPVLGQIASVLGSMPSLVTGVVTAFLAWRTITGVTNLLGKLGGVGGALNALPGQAKGAVGGINKAFAGLAIAGLTFGSTGGLQEPNDSAASKLGGLAVNVGGGALAGGMIAGPWGAAIGALIGAGVTLFQSGRAQLEAGKAEWERAWKEDHDAGPDREGSPERQLEAFPALRGVRLPSQYFPDGTPRPTGSQQISDMIRSGALPGYTVNADGSITAPDGSILPGITVPTGPVAPPPPPPPAPPPAQFSQGVPFPVAPPPRGPTTNPQFPLRTVQPAPPAVQQAAQENPLLVGPAAAAAVGDASQQVQQLATDIKELPEGEIKIKDPSPELLENLDKVDATITKVSDNEIIVKADTKTAQSTIDAFVLKYKQQQINIIVNAVPGSTTPLPQPRAYGGAIFGGIAGKDSVASLLMPGEHVLTVADVAAMGGQSNVYAFRRALHFADGGAVPGLDPGLPGDPNSVLGLLMQIRDLLAGKGGAASNPLAATAANTAQAIGGSGTSDTIGPFGTPLKKKGDLGYRMAAAAIQSLGGDPEEFLGTDPTLAAANAAVGSLGGSSSAQAMTTLAMSTLGGKAYANGPARKLFEAQGLTVGDHAADQFGEHQNGAIDIMVKNLTDGAAVLQQVLSDPNTYGAIFNNQVYGYGQGNEPRPYTGDNPHTDHVHAFYKPGGASNIDPLTGGVPLIDGMSPTGLTSANPLGYSGGPVPVYIVAGPGGGNIGGLIGQQMLGAGLDAAGQVGADVSGDVLGGIAALGPSLPPGTDQATLAKLVAEGNPMALAAALGFNVPDFTKQGGQGGEFDKNDAAYDASGRLYSDTAALSDRTTTSLAAQIEDLKKQLVDVVDQVSDKLTEDALKPIIESSIQSGLEGLKESVSAAIGTALGQAAAPPIADAVSSAVAQLPIDNTGSGSVGGDLANAATGAVGFAGGGGVPGRYLGVDSVPSMLMPGEHVFTRDDVRAMGGQNNVYAFRRALRNNGLRGFATGGGVNVNDTVGAEFFGVSEVPILSTIVNLLVRVLLKVIGVEIEARDTLFEMADDFRSFRGDFKAFDASGRLFNDTSALVDRSSTSEQEAAQERIRILKIVIQAIIKYIIEKVIVPIAKAVANAAIQAGASAAGAAVNTQAPGAGGIVSSLISSAGMAGVDIAAEVGTDFALAIADTLVDALGDAIISQGGDLATGIFGGGAVESLLVGPLTSSITNPILAAIGGLTGGLGTLLGGLFGLAAFDDGGIARGTGMMPKATIAPERVLNPTQTALFDRMVSALERGGTTGGNNTTTVHAPITVLGGPAAGESVRSKLLELID